MSSNGLLLRRKPGVLRFVDMLKMSILDAEAVHDAGRGARAFERALDGVASRSPPATASPSA